MFDIYIAKVRSTQHFFCEFCVVVMRETSLMRGGLRTLQQLLSIFSLPVWRAIRVFGVVTLHPLHSKIAKVVEINYAVYSLKICTSTVIRPGTVSVQPVTALLLRNLMQFKHQVPNSQLSAISANVYIS